MITRIVVATALLTLSGCAREEAAIKACEGFIGDQLRSPSTYKRIEATVAPHKAESRFRYVSISYDAANAYGTPTPRHRPSPRRSRRAAGA